MMKPEDIQLEVNGKPVTVHVMKTTPLLWVLREELNLTGTKFGCGRALCGACTVHVDGQPRRSCVTPAASVVGQKIRTIEGLSEGDGELHPVQQAWIDENVPQCGYCQSGQIMSAIALIEAKGRSVTDEDVDAAMAGNICRCGTYPRIRRAIKRAAQGGPALVSLPAAGGGA